MPTYREDLHLGHKVTMTETDDIVNKAITEEKLDDNSVSTRTIQDRAVTEPKLDDDAVSTRTIQNRAVTEPKMDDDSVSTRTMQNGAVTEPKMANNAVGTRTIINGSVTEEKMHENSVSTRTIIEHAVTEEKLADNSVSRRTIQEHAINNEKIDDDAIEERNIKDENVTWDKLDANTKNLVATGGGQHGTPFALDFGDSTEIGICQKTLKESRNSLQAQINEIVAGDATVSLTASPNPIFANQATNVALNATINKDALHIIIEKVVGTTRTTIAENSGEALRSLQGQTSINQDAGNVNYEATFTLAGNLHRSTSRTVNVVYPIYYGSGLVQSDVLDVAACKASARTTPTATYTVEIAGSAKYIWFFVPANMSTQITRAKMNGFDFPLETLADVTDASDVTYKVYRTPNTNEVGTYVISINPSN